MAGIAHGQGSAPATLSSRPPAKTVEPTPTPKQVEVRVSPEKSPEEKKKESKNDAAPKEQIVTEIYADEAVFDSTKSIGVFTGHIVVTDPRFQIQGDKLTIYISSKQSDGLDRAVVEGNVGVVRDKPASEGGQPSRMVGRADKAVYTAKNGNFELTGNPRVQQGLNTHVATSPETVMILNEDGQLQTKGPSRTEIRQQPKAEESPKP
jgi:lipopolysaccharide transport protein LptA